MPATGSKISEPAFKIAIGILLGLAILLTSARTLIRYRKLGQLFIDDGFLFLAAASLTVGTVLIYVNISEYYVELAVETFSEAPPPNFFSQLPVDQRSQYTSTFLLWLTIFSVKFSFLLFFRELINRIRQLRIWWWFVLIVLVPASVICMCTQFIACPSFGPNVIVECATRTALARENAALQAAVILDTLTDGLLISIPVILLWRVHIRLRQKLILGGILCLSIVMIIISIIKVTTANLASGFVDVPWSIFTLQAEASVAVTVVSLSAFRSLFTDGTNKERSNKSIDAKKRLLWQEKMSGTFPSNLSTVHSHSRTRSWAKDEDAWLRPNSTHVTSDNLLGAAVIADTVGIRVTHDIRTFSENKVRQQEPLCFNSIV